MAATNGAKKFLQHILAVAIEGGGFDKTLSKLRIVSGGKGRCIAEMRIEKEHTNRIGVLHGGFTAMLVDAVSTMALRTTEKAVPGISVDISVTYLGVDVSADGFMKDEVNHRIEEGKKIFKSSQDWRRNNDKCRNP
ncbi:acyl-coenzyme A thioesterase 13 isoform X2 [Cherax quadricarinatus]|uniref:acyl-coenzyme A thioesterase 13 isoform X2 n=1 Tax=Cherax quadricarinatus TaxID=27406 RepID=UPI00387EB476